MRVLSYLGGGVASKGVMPRSGGSAMASSSLDDNSRFQNSSRRMGGSSNWFSRSKYGHQQTQA